MVVGGLSGLVGALLSGHMLLLLGAAPDVAQGGAAYLRISLYGIFTAFVLFVVNAVFQGAGDSLTPMYIMALANLLNLVLDPLFIFGIGPFPRLGIRGAALASVLAQALAAVLAATLLFRHRAPVRIRLAQCRPDLGMSWRILRIGIPGTGQMLSRSLMGVVMMRVVAACGTAAVAAYGTGMRFHMIILMPAFALGGAVAPLVGQNLGAGKPDRARRTAWLATWIDVAFTAGTALVIVPLAPLLIRAFNPDAEVVRIGAQYLRIVSPFYVFAAPGVILGRALGGAGDTMAPMVFTVISLWGLQIPLALLLARHLQPATQGIWWAMVAATVLHGLLVAGWFETGRWRHARV